MMLANNTATCFSEFCLLAVKVILFLFFAVQVVYARPVHDEHGDGCGYKSNL
jgi:hypothetical protein